jgi:hypothetical protein
MLIFASNVLGFSAPMALPGQETVDPSAHLPVVILPGLPGKFGFMFELA